MYGVLLNVAKYYLKEFRDLIYFFYKIFYMLFCYWHVVLMFVCGSAPLNV